MKRTFVQPSDDGQPSRFVTLDAPYDATFTSRSGAWGNKGRALTTRCDDHASAIQAYIDQVSGLLGEGYIELPPRITYRKGASEVTFRYPVFPVFSVIRDGKKSTRRHDDMRSAVLACNSLIVELHAEGYAVARPSFGEVYAEPDPKRFELVTVFEKDNPKQVKKRYYQSLQDPDEEFGPEWWYRDGEVWQHNFQLQTERHGPTVEYRADFVRAIMTYHDGVYHGPSIFSQDGDPRIENLLLRHGEKEKTLSLEIKDDIVTQFTKDGTDANGEFRGMWYFVRDHGVEQESYFDPPGVLSLREEYATRNGERFLWRVREFEGGVLSREVMRNASGQITRVQNWVDEKPSGIWEETDSQNRTVKVYNAPGELASVSFYRLDGTLEQAKFFAAGRLTGIDFHSPDGTINERRERKDNDTWWSTCLHPDGETVAAQGALDSFSRRTGPWSFFDASGEPISNPEGGPDDYGPPADQPVAQLLHCFEHVDYGSPSLDPSSFGKTDVPGVYEFLSLEDHLARLYCFASEQLDTLRPDDKGKRSRIWKHTSDSGSLLTLTLKKKQLDSATLHRADGSLAAEVRFTWGHVGVHGDAHIHITLYREDGTSVLRSGDYRALHDYSRSDNRLCVQRDGWWNLRDASGAIEHALHFSTGSQHLLAHNDYREELAAKSKPSGDLEPLVERASKLAAKPASRERFLAICAIVEEAAAQDMEGCASALIPVIREAVEAWPVELRQAPLLWINRLVMDALPIDALHLVSALSLSATLAATDILSKHFPLLLAWLRDYPADGPAPEGISLTLRDSVLRALGEARKAERDKRFRPVKSIDVDEAWPVEQDHWPIILSSPLLRSVRVLDLSWDPPYRDFGWDYQGLLDGRGLKLSTVHRHITSDSLEVLSLRGQCKSTSNQLGEDRLKGKKGASQLPRIAKLRMLDLGGGHPLGDAAFKRVAAWCPELRVLSVKPGPAGDILEGHDFDEEVEWDDLYYRRISEHWGIYDNADIERMRPTSKGWKAISQLEHLEHLYISRKQGSPKLPEGVKVETWDEPELWPYED